MAIKDKEGNVYRLRHPNPLMKNQKRDWDYKKLKLINMGWESETHKDVENPVEKFKEEFNVVDVGEKIEEAKVIPTKEFVEEISEPEPEPEPETIPKPVLNVPTHLAEVLKQRGVEYFCAPAVGRKEHVDELYGESHYTIEYGQQFIFDAVVIETSDLEIQFWCVKPISEHSIIHPRTKEKGQRWWRVKEIEEKTGGYLCLAITSDVNPDFS